MRKILAGVLSAALGFAAIYLLTLVYLRYLPPLGTTVQLQKRIEAHLAGEPYARHYEYTPLSRVSEHLPRAVIAAEDTRFFEHAGIDWIELRNVIERSLERGALGRGGSTITQQLVKNLYLTTHRSAVRKGFEMPMALVADAMLSKDRILELYLNVIEWGPGVFGVEAAAQYHYGKPASEITREEASRLAACIPAPLERRPQEMDEYSLLIRKRMHVMGW